MQTRRDQLQAYRFQNRRALAALVTGQPNVLEPPMRRLTVTTLSGIMIAILVAIVFGILAIIHPSAGNSWMTQGAVVVDGDNNTTYIYTDKALHPVVNYTSAVLATGGMGKVSPIKVSSSDIAGAKYSYEIGIPTAPSLPTESSLIGFPMSACSVQVQNRAGVGANARVTLHVGSDGGKTAVPAIQAVLVNAPGETEYLLFQGHRMAVGSPQVASALGFSAASPVVVGTAFVNSVPLGTPLAPPRIKSANKLATYAVGARHPRIGSVVMTSDTHKPYLVLPSGTVALTPLERDLFTASPIVSATQQEATTKPFPPAALTTARNPLSVFDTLPSEAPKIDRTAVYRAGVCAVFERGADTPHFVLPARALTSTYVPGQTGESTASMRGRADNVDVPALKGVLATPAGSAHTVLIISDQGIKYSFSSASLIGAFGYSSSDVVRVQPALLTLIPNDPTGLSKAAALRRVPH